MATMNQLMTALRAADAAGNTQDATRIAQIIKGMQPQQQGTDGAFAYGVDRAQQLAGKGIEVVGNLVGSEGPAQTGSNIVAQQEKDIAAGGYTPTYTGSLADTYKDGGISAAIGWIGEKTAENAASGGVAIAGTGLAALTAPFSTTAALVLGGGTLATSALMGAGEAAQEQEEKTGEYDARVASGVGVLIGILDRFGAGKVIPKSKLATMSGEEVVDALMKAGKPNAAAAVGRRIAGSTLGEAGTEVAQDAAVVASTAAMGGEYTGEELRDRALESAVIGGTIGGGTRAGIETVGAAGRGVRATIPGGYTPTDPEAAADLANRLQAIADRDGIELKNINLMDPQGSRAAVDQAHKEITGDLKAIRSEILATLRPADADSDQVREDKIAIQRGFDNARTKTKNTVGSAELAALQRLLGNTQEGQQIARLWRQSNELTELHNRGYKGGVSQYTDALSPIGNPGYSDRALIELPTRLGITGAAAGVTGGASIPAQIGAVAAGRGIDALTGRRSAVAKFVRDQQAQQGTSDPTGQSVRAARALAQQQQEEADAAEAQRKRDLAMEATRRNEPPKGDPTDPNPSPQYTMETAAGLTRTGVARALRIIERTRPDLVAAVEGYRRMLITGEASGDLTPLIRAVKGVVRNSPETFEDVRTDQPQAEAQTDDRRERGKAANMKEIARLQREVNDSNGIAVSDKALLNQALEEFKQPLGADPVAAAQSIVDEVQANLRKPELADKYLAPYVKRITRQQRGAKKALVVEQDYKLPPTDTPEDMGFPRRPEDEVFMNDRDRAYDLRNRLDSLMGYVFTEKDIVGKRNKKEFVDSVLKEGAKEMTDPDGRRIMSFVAAGKYGDEGLTNDQVEKIAPFLVEFFDFINGTPNPNYLGRFMGRENYDETITGESIEVIDIDERYGDKKMDVYRFMDTLFHEMGHAVEAQSELRSFLTELSYLRGDSDPKMDPLIMKDGKSREGYKEAVRLSKIRRSGNWRELNRRILLLQQQFGGVEVPAFEELKTLIAQNKPVRDMDAFNVRESARRAFEKVGRIDMVDNPTISDLVQEAANAIRYLYRPAELGADAVAEYMRKPGVIKKDYPALAKLVRGAVNGSKMGKYISFHSIAGLLGPAAALAAVQAALGPGEEEGDQPALAMPQGALTT